MLINVGFRGFNDERIVQALDNLFNILLLDKNYFILFIFSVSMRFHSSYLLFHNCIGKLCCVS